MSSVIETEYTTSEGRNSESNAVITEPELDIVDS